MPSPRPSRPQSRATTSPRLLMRHNLPRRPHAAASVRPWQAGVMTTTYLDKHREKLDAAVAACASREYYSAYDESPSPRVYGETAAGEGKAAFEAWLGRAFPVETPGSEATVRAGRSPFGFGLGVAYPRARDVDVLLTGARAGMGPWRDAGPDVRTGVCI